MNDTKERNIDMFFFTLYGLFSGIFLTITTINLIYQQIPNIKPKANMSEKMDECIKNNGQFSIRNFSWTGRDDYRMTCKITEKELWHYKF